MPYYTPDDDEIYVSRLPTVTPEFVRLVINPLSGGKAVFLDARTAEKLGTRIVELAREALAAMPIPELPNSAERIRLRQSANVSQDELAALLGVSRRTIHAWEHGKSDPEGNNRVAYADQLAQWQAGKEH